MTPEFDSYAREYQDLLHDPIRDRFAGNSDYFHRRKADLIQEFFNRRKLTTNDMSWLDVGCGKGELLNVAGSNFARVMGCDPSPKMIDGCAGIETFKQPSATDLPFPNESFDFVTAVCVYHHVQRAEQAELTKSIHRVLKPGGIFCIIEHNPFNPITQLIVHRCPLDVEAILMTSGHTAAVVRSAGFTTIETSYFLYLPQSLAKCLTQIEGYLRWLPLGGQYAVFSTKGGA
jgi:SAM-dependent methyltransferase